jgi:hypothetical protein
VTVSFEGRACDAVLRLIETRENAERANIKFPDQDSAENIDARIDVACNVGETLYAFEHTSVEPFAGYHKAFAESDLRIQPVVARVRQDLTVPDCVLIMPVATMQRVKGKKLARAQTALVDFIVAEGPKLPITHLDGSDALMAQPPGFPSKIKLYRHARDPYVGPTPFRVHLTDPLTPERRRERIRKVCEYKYPKLAKWRDRGAKTVLILEENDMTSTSPWDVYFAIAEVERDRSDRPDEIYLVSTNIGNDKWWLSTLRQYDLGYDILSERGVRHASYKPTIEIGPNTLEDITGRGG